MEIFTGVSQRITALNSRIDDMMNKAAIRKQLGKNLPGANLGGQAVSTEGVEIIVNSGMRNSGNIVISADGPFMARALHLAARLYDPDVKFLNPWGQLSYEKAILLGNEIVNNFDSYIEYQVSGSKRQRQNIPIPSCLFARAYWGGGYFKLPMADIFPPVSTITIWITSTCALDSHPVLLPQPHRENSPFKIIYYAGFSGVYLTE
jgi:hypothetical protein